MFDHTLQGLPGREQYWNLYAFAIRFQCGKWPLHQWRLGQLCSSLGQSMLIIWQVCVNFFLFLRLLGWWEVQEPSAEVSRPDLGLHHGLVQSLAKGGVAGGGQTLLVGLQHCLHGRGQGAGRVCHGCLPGPRGRGLYWLFPPVCTCSVWNLSNSLTLIEHRNRFQVL